MRANPKRWSIRRVAHHVGAPSRRVVIVTTSVVLVGAATFFGLTSGADASKSTNVTICHRTNSVTNPYERITVDESAVNDPARASDHLHHLGAVFDFAADPEVKYPTPRNGDQWGDIVPPFDEDGTRRADPTLTLNWPAGKAIFDAGCANPNSVPVTAGGTIGYFLIMGFAGVAAGALVVRNRHRGAHRI